MDRMDRDDVAMQFDRIAAAAGDGADGLRAGDDEAALEQLGLVAKRHHEAAVDLGALMAGDPEPPPDPDTIVYKFDFIPGTGDKASHVIPLWEDLAGRTIIDVEYVVEWTEENPDDANLGQLTDWSIPPSQGNRWKSRSFGSVLMDADGLLRVNTDSAKKDTGHARKMTVTWSADDARTTFFGDAAEKSIPAPATVGAIPTLRIGNEDTGRETLSKGRHWGKVTLTLAPF